jgi:hypothetical protein
MDWWKVALTSLASLVVMLVVAGVVIVKLPADHLRRERPARSRARKVGKNALGALLLLAGVAMIILPGPGILGVVLGLSLLDVPGKRRLVGRALGHPRALRSINALRARFGAEPLQPPARGPSTPQLA